MYIIIELVCEHVSFPKIIFYHQYKHLNSVFRKRLIPNIFLSKLLADPSFILVCGCQDSLMSRTTCCTQHHFHTPLILLPGDTVRHVLHGHPRPHTVENPHRKRPETSGMGGFRFRGRGQVREGRSSSQDGRI